MQNSRSIILIDDDEDDQEIFKTACARIDSSIMVSGFLNGEHALEGLVKMNILPDIIFLDLNMPRLNGLEILGRLKSVPRLNPIPVIVYTTSFDSVVKEKCLALGAIEVVEKPSCFNSLCDKLESLLQILA